MAGKIQYTKSFLAELENLIAESDYILRYEKGHFKSGYCLLHKQKVVLISKFYTTKSRINTLLDILGTLPIDTLKLTEKGKNTYETLLKMAQDKPIPLTQ